MRGAAGEIVVREVLMTLLAPAGLGSGGPGGGCGFGIEPVAAKRLMTRAMRTASESKVISEPTQFVAGRFVKPLRFATSQQLQITTFHFSKKKLILFMLFCAGL